ncbi:MAG: hypothetical protein HY288_01520 [Planctomycetia bacterium]|nr:hypothetical protein [Planctomycetia bacterium]
MKTLTSIAALLVLVVCAGCESNAPSSSTTQAAQAAPAPPPPPPAAPAAAAAPAEAAASAAGQAVTSPPPADPAAAQPVVTSPPTNAPAEPATAGDPANREKAQVGVGKQGRDYKPGFITTPVAAFFSTEQRIAFEVQIPHAMKLYKANHENKGPKTHEEFWEAIIKENAVQLPELPPGDSFIYDPKTEELMVQHPKDQ